MLDVHKRIFIPKWSEGYLDVEKVFTQPLLEKLLALSMQCIFCVNIVRTFESRIHRLDHVVVSVFEIQTNRAIVIDVHTPLEEYFDEELSPFEPADQVPVHGFVVCFFEVLAYFSSP